MSDHEGEGDPSVGNTPPTEVDSDEIFNTPESEDEDDSDSDLELDTAAASSDGESETEDGVEEGHENENEDLVLSQLSQISLDLPIDDNDANADHEMEDSQAEPEVEPNDIVWDWVSGTGLAEENPLPFTSDGPAFVQHNFQERKELNFFREFLTEEILDLIVENTNLYHRQTTSIPHRCSRRMLNFKPVGHEDILRLIAVRICMGLDKKPKQTDYWTENRFYKSAIVPKIMTVDRYKDVSRYLHFCNNEHQHQGDRLFKISKFMKLVVERTQLMLNPGKNICVDESLVLYKGRLYFKQYIPSKAAKFGIKIFIIADSETGYILHFFIYHGAGHQFKYSTKDYGFGGAVALELAERYLNCGRCLYIDNYFTNVRIARKLLSVGTNMCGTLRKRLKFNPPMTSKLRANQIETYSSNGVLVERWKDRREVRMISTGHAHVAVTKVKRGVERTKPETSNVYTKLARSIDRADQIIGSYDMLRKSVKWYKKIFFHVIDLLLYNACVMYSKQHGHIPIKKFKENVVTQILEEYGEHNTKRGRKTSLPSLQSSSRLTERHYPSLVPTPNPNATRKPTKNCVVCLKKHKKRTQTRYMCEKCNVGLCAAGCFETHHEVRHYQRR